jgi:hypothetical protein
MKFPILNLIFSVSLLGLEACAFTKGKEKPKPPIIKLLISIEQGPCQGKCTRFNADFYSGRKMVYLGISRMPLLGNYSYFIPEQLPENLLSEALKLKLPEMPDSIPSPEGEQRLRLRFLLPNGRFKQISAGNLSAPASFLAFIKILNGEVRAFVEDQEGEKIP